MANRPRVQRAQRAVQWQGINCPSGRAIAPEFSSGANAIIGCLFRQDNYDGIVGGIVGGGGTGGIIWKHVCPGVDVRVLWASTLVLWSRTLFENRLWGTGVPISMAVAVLVRNAELESLYRGREVFIDNTPPPPRHPARRQAKSPDPRSRLGAWDLLSQGRRLLLKQPLPQPLGGVPRPPTDIWALYLPLEPDPTVRRAVGAPLGGPQPHSDGRWRPGARRWRYDNKLDGSAACPPVTRFSSPGYNLVLRVVAIPERFRGPSGIPRNLSITPNSP